MITPAEFDDIRPYSPEELPAIFEELIADEEFKEMMTRAFPQLSYEQISGMKLVGLVLANGLVGLSGGLYTQYLGSVTVNMGRGAIVIGLAAVIIGEVLLGKIFRNFALRLSGVVIGAIIYYVVIALVIQLGLNTDDLKLFSAAFVAVALFIPYWKSNHGGKTLAKGGKNHA